MAFLDTYALVKLAEDPDFLKEVDVVTLHINLAELHYVLLRKHGEQIADHFIKLFYSISIETLPLDLIIHANKFRYKNKKRNFSYFDALGYQYALDNNMTFITGDKAFKGIKNVKIVR